LLFSCPVSHLSRSFVVASLLMLALEPLVAAGPRQGLRALKKTTVIVTAGVTRGPLGLVSASSELGLAVGACAAEGRQGFFWQNGAGCPIGGFKVVSSFNRKLRGLEYGVGPRGVGHPVYGERASFTPIGEYGISAAKTGGLGISGALPIPGWNFLTEGRFIFSVYVANPGLCRVSGAVNDGIDRLTGAACKLAAPIVRPAGKLWRGVTTGARRALSRVRLPGKRGRARLQDEGAAADHALPDR